MDKSKGRDAESPMEKRAAMTQLMVGRIVMLAADNREGEEQMAGALGTMALGMLKVAMVHPEWAQALVAQGMVRRDGDPDLEDTLMKLWLDSCPVEARFDEVVEEFLTAEARGL